ncbi:hypothetical protein DICVIV_12677 [Dictyocaulus viviparus]|uniref:NFACT RNA-binding domain-containing protein n=1 Tax=Dictyocaulus viviparus TaxID=29172 RepID=A0A0D8XC55_DICVI|nr:hypothetical protein DICVIV_12677 [Dictyocaulus viviparus]
MKYRFTALDVSAAVNDLKILEGARIINVYDINHKTYIMKLSRLCKINQVGVDRIVDMQIDSDERCFHVILELYDRGNIVLTDKFYTILNILRPRTEKDTDVKLVVKERYPLPPPPVVPPLPSTEEIMQTLTNCDQKLPLKRAVVSPGIYSGVLIEHALIVEGLDPDLKVDAVENKSLCASHIVSAITNALKITEEVQSGHSLGYILYKVEKRSDGNDVETLLEYHPYLFAQLEKGLYKKYNSFCEAVDAFYAVQSSQKQQQDALKVEKEALKKLENVKMDQSRRLVELEENRNRNMNMANLIIFNQDLVDSAINIISTAIAQKASWYQISEMHRKAVENNDPIATAIVKLDLENNRILMRLSDEDSNSYDVPIDVSMTAFNNSRKLYQGMKAAAEKIIRTEAAAEKAIRNAEVKTHNAIKQVHVRVDTAKHRKELWFEKFIWFISSDSYMVIVGRDAQQNELLVKRYLRAEDIYVHADAHGAASVVIRNKKGGGLIPPRTMTEAAQMAVCFSSSWSCHIVSAAWWVYAHQVSKIAPSGEYLVQGGFMIRGKKNFLPCSPLLLGFGILFRIDDVSVNLESVDEGTADIDEVSKSGTTTNGATGDDYPDIHLDVPSTRCHEDASEEYSVIDFGVQGRKKKDTVIKEKVTQQYLERKNEEQQKAIFTKKREKYRRRKMEKIRKKYRDQDDDEREMRLALLGSKGKSKAEPSINISGPSLNGSNTKNKPINASTEEIKNEVDESHIDGEVPIFNVEKHSNIDSVQDKDADDTGIPPTNSTQMSQPSLDDEYSKEDQIADDDIESKETAVAEDTEGLISQLVSDPLPDDVLLCALAMVGPYQAFSKFKYKAKITPGTSKKGKAGKAALDLFLRMKHGDNREQVLIRTLVGDENTFRNIPKGSRILAPHLHAK